MVDHAECFRFNNRKTDDGNRFLKVLGQVEGKRLTYKLLIGKSNPVLVSRNDIVEESAMFDA